MCIHTHQYPQKTHLPGYVESYDKLKGAGVEVIVCTSVNDPFVMAAVRCFFLQGVSLV